MPDPKTRSDEILDAAEKMARTGGYNGFSFREIAKAVGIKAASVHYHFPGKNDLGAAIAKRYTDRFLEGLGDPEDPARKPDQLLSRYVEAYRHALVEDQLMCLCGILGAEVAYLPDKVAAETRVFFERNVDWLVRVIERRPQGGGDSGARARALHMIAALEGAMILARTLGDTAAFDAAVTDLTG